MTTKTALISIVAILLGQLVSAAAEPHPVLGTWRLAGVRIGGDGEWNKVPETITQLKHFTPTHFHWVQFNSKTKEIQAAGGGRVTFDEEKFVETIEHGLGDVLSLLGQEQKFEWKIEDGMFYQSGTLSNGAPLAEKYVRVPSEDNQKSPTD